MATVVLPRSLVELFPGLARRHDVAAGTVASVIDGLDVTAPGLRDRLIETGPRLRSHINVYVAGRPADLATAVADDDTVHVIPAVSGGAVAATTAGARSQPAGPSVQVR
jgi:molybdopterin converting factor small subunit